jgi:hypothetical protein
VDWFPPTGTVLVKAVGAVGILANPLIKTGVFDPATPILPTTNQVMDKFELDLYLAALKRRFQPVVLRLSQGPIPAEIRSLGPGLAGRIPEWVQHYKQRITPCPGIVAITDCAEILI